MTRISIAVMSVLMFAALIAAALGLASGRTPSEYLISIGALPLGAGIAATILSGRGRGDLISAWAVRLFAGAAAGLAATLTYDGYRVGVRDVLGIAFDPFRVQPVFGQILTGLPTTHPIALTAGWSYHIWTGLILGMIFAALRPRGSLISGAAYGAGFAVIVQLGRWLMYPDVLMAGTSDKEFFANGVVGQLVWGAVLGLVVAWLTGRLGEKDQKLSSSI